MDKSVSIYDNRAVDRLRSELRVEPQRIRRLRTAFFKKSQGVDASLAELPSEVRDEFAQHVGFHCLNVLDRYDSEQDGATRLVLRTDLGFLLESVILRSGTGRTSLCISSQIGCGAACEFCATGKMGLAHDLSPAEILDQVVHAGELLASEQRRVRNIVFMGMGEPFHNEQALYEAVGMLVDPVHFHHTPGRIMISTVGIPVAMVRCARRFPHVRLALSLHSVRQDVRQKLIPLARKYPLDELRRTIETVNTLQSHPLMIEYLMLAGINDSLNDAADLVQWLAGNNVHVNLIPYNPVDGAPHLRCTPRQQRDAFAGVLKAASITTTIRYSLGADISAACGQLVQGANRRLAALQARASI